MKLRLPVRLLAAVVAAASHVAFLTVASASGAWAVENASVDLTFVDSADAPAIVADGESLAELPSAQSAEEAVVTLSDAEAEKVTAADAALPEEIAAAGDSVVVTAPMTAEDVAEVSAAPEVKTVGGANTTENVTGGKLLAEEAALVTEYNAIMPGAEGTETPAVSYPANNAAVTQTAAAANLTVPETTVASDNTTTLNLSAASAAPQTQTAALTTETVSGSTGATSSSSAVSSSYSAPTFMTTGADVSAPRSAPVVFLTGAATENQGDVQQTSVGINPGRIKTDDSSLLAYFDFSENNTPVAGTQSTGWSKYLTRSSDGYGITSSTSDMRGQLSGATGDSFTISFDVQSVTAGTLLGIRTEGSGQTGAWRNIKLTSTDDGGVTLVFMGKQGEALSGQITSGAWNNITIVGGPTGTNTINALTFYVNGGLIGEINMDNAGNVTGKSVDISMGSGFGADVTTASIDNILFYKRALNADDVASLLSSAALITWAGTDANHIWTASGVWAESETFNSGDDVVFGSEGCKTVTINSAITAGAVTVDGNSTYTFNGSGGSLKASSVTVSAGSTLVNSSVALNTTIDGSGVYKTTVQAQDHVLGANVRLADTWMGEVWLSGTATSLNLSDAKKDGSTLVLNGLTGYLASWNNGECNQDLKLVDNGTTKAITFTNGGSDYVQTFSGAFSGKGTFNYSSNQNPQKYGDLVFTGNLTEFGGTFNANVHAFVDGTKNLGEKNSEGIMQFGSTSPAAYSSAAAVTDRVIHNIAGDTNSSIYSSSVVRFNYAASDNKLGVDNKSIHARYIEFNRDGGTAEYLVTAALEGHAGEAANNTIKVSGGKATLSGTITGFGNVIANGGDVDVLNLTDATQIKNLTLASGRIAGFYTGATVSEDTEATLTLTNLTVQGNATLNANISLGSGSTLSLAGTLAMGSDVSLTSQVTLVLSDALKNQLDGGSSVTLFGGVDSFNSGTESVSVSADTYFGSDWADYTLRYANRNVILTVLYNYWKDSDGNWSDEDGWYDTAALTGDAHAFVSGNVYFANTHTVNLTADVTAKNMVVSGGKTLTLDTGAYNLAASSLTGGDDAQGGNLIKKGTGSVSINGLVSMTGLDVQGGTVSVVGVLSGQDKGSIGEIKSSAGTTLSLANVTANVTGSNNQQLKGSLTIGSGAVVNVSNTDNMDYNATNTIRIETDGELHFNDGGRWTVGSNNKIVMAGGSVTGNGASDNGALDFYGSNTLKAEKTSIISAPVRLRGDVTVDVDANQTLTMGTITQQGGDRTLTKTGEGTLTLTSTLSNSTVTVTGGVLDLNDKQHSNLNTLNITNATVKTTSNNGNGCVGGTININSGGRFEVNGGHDALGWSSNNYTDKLVLQGTDNTEAGRATLYLNQTTDRSVTMSSVIEMKGNARIQNGDGKIGFNTFTGCSIAVSGTNNRIDSIDVRKDATLATDAGAELTIGKLTKNRETESDNAVLTKAGDGTLILDGDTANPYITISGGTLNLLSTVNIVGSALTMGSGTTLALSEMDDNAVTFTSLTFSGNNTLDLTRLSLAEGVTSYTLATSTDSISDVNNVTFTLGSSYNHDDYELAVEGNTLVLNYTPASTNLIWAGGERLWDNDAAHHEWLTSTDLVGYKDGANVTFLSKEFEETPDTALLGQDVYAKTMTVQESGNVTIRNANTDVPYTLTVDDMVVNGYLHTEAAMKVKKSLAIGEYGLVHISAIEDFELDTPVSGNGMLVKDGAATVTVSGNNGGFSGDVDVYEGTLVVGNENALGTGVVTVEAESTLQLKQDLTLNLGTLWVEDGGRLSFGTGSSLQVTNDMFMADNSIVNLRDYVILPGSGDSYEDITLATVGGVLEATGDNIILTLPTGYHGRLVNDGSTLTVTDIERVDLYYWKGGPGVWSDVSWYLGQYGSELKNQADGADVVFDKRTASSAVTVVDQANTGTMTVTEDTRVVLMGKEDGSKLKADQLYVLGSLETRLDVDAKLVDLHGENSSWTVVTDAGIDRTFAGIIDCRGTLVKDGAGELTLTGDNSGFSGKTLIKAGTLHADSTNGHALGYAPRVEMSDGTELSGTLKVTHTNSYISSVDASGSACVSANMELAKDAVLTFDGAGVLTVSGEISGSGAVVKDGSGTLTLDHANTMTGTLEIQDGKVQVAKAAALGRADVMVDSGAVLALSSVSGGVQMGGSLAVGVSGVLAVGGNENLHVVGNLTLGTYAVLDLSNVALDPTTKRAVIATVDGTVSSYEGSAAWEDDRLKYVAVQNLSGATGAAAGVLTTHLYFDKENKQLYVALEEVGTGMYWVGSKTPGADTVNYSGSWTQDGTNWNAANNTEGVGGAKHADENSAYFMNDATATVSVTGHTVGQDKTGVLVNQLIVGAGDYTFTGDVIYVGLTGSGLSEPGVVVREGASATFNKIEFSDNSNILVERDASLIIKEPEEAVLKDVNNYGNFSMTIANGQFHLTRLYNAAGATMQLLSPVGLIDNEDIPENGVNFISVVNDGTLIIDQGHVLSLATEAAGGVATDIMNTGTVEFRADNAKVMDYFGELGLPLEVYQGIIVSMPVRGEGKVITSGDHFVYFNSGFYVSERYRDRLASVEASELTLGAALSRFDAQVTVYDSTTVQAGKTAQFFAEGELAEVTMEAGSTMQLQGGMVSKGEAHLTSGAYVMDSLLSTGTGQTVEVTKGAMAHSRGSTGLADGHLVVGAEDDTVASTYVSDDNAGIYLLDMYANAVVTLNGDTNSIGTANVTSGSLTTKGTAEIDTLNQGSGSTTLNGESLVTQLNQTAGSVNINEDSTLVNGSVAGGIMALADGKELTVKNVIHAAGAYTLAATTGTINADALTLTVAGGYENTAKVITADQSGFLNAGDESVRVFDNGSGRDAALTLGDGVHTVTHSSASGELVLGADGVAVRRGDGTNYLAYYVRDNYVTGLAEGRTEAGDSGRTPASDMTADSVKLTDIYTAAEIGGAVLERVVFDKTDYNSTKTGLYHGMLTVDTDTAVQLFRVAADTQAALNVEEGKVLSADAAYTGVQGALDLQGQGVYELQNRNNLGANVALRDDTQKAGEEWDGTVRLTGTSDDVNLTGMSVGTGNDASTIEFKHWSGSLASGPLATDGRILLTGTNVAESAAMTLTGGSGVDYTFNNTVSGENAIVQHNGGDGVKLTFNASTAGWTGQYVQNTDTTDTLKFLGGTEANAGVAVSAGVADVTYGGTLQTVNSAATVYGGGELDLHYVNGTVESPLVVSSVLYSDALSTLTLTVGDGSEAAVTKFTGVFVGTENATMHVEDNSAATLATNAALLRVVGDAGSMVTVNEDETLTLTSTEAETYSEFHGLTNDGTIAMKADGGDIRLVADADETTFDAGKVVLSGAAGTATIETAVAAEQTATVNVTDLHGPAADTQVLALENQNGTGTVNYNLGGDTEVQGTIRFGTDSEVAEATGTTNVVLNSDTVAADAVLESAGAGKANVVVNTADARVLGLSSVEEGGNGKVYGEGSVRSLTITGDDTYSSYSYNGALGENLNIAYTGSGKQTIAGGATDFNGAVNVNNSDTETGILQMMNATTVKITDLAIGANDKLGISSTTQTERADEYGTAVVAKVMTTAEGAAMNANMRLEDSAVVSLGADGTLGNDALTMGMGNVSLGHNMTLAGDAINNALATVQEAWDATEGGLGSGNFDLTKHNYRVVLFDEVGSLTLGGQTFTEAVVNTDYIFARDYFSNLGALADYYVITFTQQGSAGFEVALEVIPEPTTSTLSLLALAALCARRRRKA